MPEYFCLVHELIGVSLELIQLENTVFENKKTVLVCGSSGMGYAAAQKTMNTGTQVVFASHPMLFERAMSQPDL